jgi:hypothetical protein
MFRQNFTLHHDTPFGRFLIAISHYVSCGVYFRDNLPVYRPTVYYLLDFMETWPHILPSHQGSHPSILFLSPATLMPATHLHVVLFETSKESLNSLCALVTYVYSLISFHPAMRCNSHTFVASVLSPLCQLHSTRLPVEGNIVSFTWEVLDVNDETVLFIVDNRSIFSKLISDKAKNNLHRESNGKQKSMFLGR